MGNFITTLPMAQPGCFTSYSTILGQPNVFPMGLIYAPEEDCDCHRIKTCPPGEPPPPPLTEFIQDERIAKVLGFDIVPLVPPPKVEDVHTNRPPGWDAGYNPLAGDSDYPQDPNSEHPGGTNTKDIWGHKIEPRIRRRAAMPRPNDRTKQAYPNMHRSLAYRSAIWAQYFYLPPEQRDRILLNGQSAMRYVEYIRKEAVGGNLTALDTRPIMAMLLADPHLLAGDVVKLMSPKDASLLLYCTDFAFEAAFKAIREKAIGDNADPKDKKHKYRVAYYKFFRRLAAAWRGYTPKGLNREAVSKLQFPAVGPGKLAANAVCKEVWTDAVNTAKGGSGYLAGMDIVAGTMGVQMAFSVHQAYQSAIGLPELMNKGAKYLNFDNDRLESAFREAWPEFRVAASMFVLSLWTGDGFYTEDMLIPDAPQNPGQ